MMSEDTGKKLAFGCLYGDLLLHRWLYPVAETLRIQPVIF